jgi:tetratricopeptide (TPR) repeat protein
MRRRRRSSRACGSNSATTTAPAEAAIAIDPKNIDAREGLLEYYLSAPSIAGGDRKKAERMADEPGQPTWAHAHWRLGLVLEKSGRRADAVMELEQATRLKPDLEDAKKDLRRLRTS